MDQIAIQVPTLLSGCSSLPCGCTGQSGPPALSPLPPAPCLFLPRGCRVARWERLGPPPVCRWGSSALLGGSYRFLGKRSVSLPPAASGDWRGCESFGILTRCANRVVSRPRGFGGSRLSGFLLVWLAWLGCGSLWETCASQLLGSSRARCLPAPSRCLAFPLLPPALACPPLLPAPAPRRWKPSAAAAPPARCRC